MMSRDEAKADAEKTWIPPLAPIHYVDDLPEGIVVGDVVPVVRKKFIDCTFDTKTGVMYDPVHKPLHYTQYPGVEVIQLTEHMTFCKGNAVKYIARAEFKGHEIQDLEKAAWYINREIARLKSL